SVAAGLAFRLRLEDVFLAVGRGDVKRERVKGQRPAHGDGCLVGQRPILAGPVQDDLKRIVADARDLRADLRDQSALVRLRGDGRRQLGELPVPLTSATQLDLAATAGDEKNTAQQQPATDRLTRDPFHDVVPLSTW